MERLSIGWRRSLTRNTADNSPARSTANAKEAIMNGTVLYAGNYRLAPDMPLKVSFCMPRLGCAM